MSKLRVSKTNFWKTEGGDVFNLEELPSSVQQQIEIYDVIRQDLADCKYQEQVLSMAAAMKKQQLDAIINSIASAQSAQKNQEKEVAGSAEPEDSAK